MENYAGFCSSLCRFKPSAKMAWHSSLELSILNCAAVECGKSLCSRMAHDFLPMVSCVSSCSALLKNARSIHSHLPCLATKKEGGKLPPHPLPSQKVSAEAMTHACRNSVPIDYLLVVEYSPSQPAQD